MNKKKIIILSWSKGQLLSEINFKKMQKKVMTPMSIFLEGYLK